MTSLAGTQTLTGGFATTISEPPQVIVTPTEDPASRPGWVVPAAIAIILISAVTQGGSDEGGDDGGRISLSETAA